jgi:hypothetical protein
MVVRSGVVAGLMDTALPGRLIEAIRRQPVASEVIR